MHQVTGVFGRVAVDCDIIGVWLLLFLRKPLRSYLRSLVFEAHGVCLLAVLLVRFANET